MVCSNWYLVPLLRILHTERRRQEGLLHENSNAKNASKSGLAQAPEHVP